ncbi:MAG: hypothetical protein V3R30_04120 [Kiloniellales bacterium]
MSAIKPPTWGDRKFADRPYVGANIPIGGGAKFSSTANILNNASRIPPTPRLEDGGVSRIAAGTHICRAEVLRSFTWRRLCAGNVDHSAN